MTKIVYISWAPYCSRSDNTARELGGKSYMVYCDFMGSNYFTVVFKYLLQSLKTFSILFRDRPDAVFVMSPSVFATIPVYLYCNLFRAIYIIDMHTGALDHPMWHKVLFLQHFFCRKALLTIVTNLEIQKWLEGWGGEALIVPDVPIECANARIPKLEGAYNITLVNTFANDEPVAVFLKATQRFPSIQFHVTGKLGRKEKVYRDSRLDNVRFTDFLENKDYYGLLMASDLIVVLTTRDHTMQRGAYEAIYLGKPIVTSDWPVLRDNFPIGAEFVNNSEEGIFLGIEKGLSHLDKLSHEALLLKKRKEKTWLHSKKTLLEAIKKRGLA